MKGAKNQERLCGFVASSQLLLTRLANALVQANLTMMTFVATVCANFHLKLAPEVRHVKKWVALRTSSSTGGPHTALS